MPAGESVGHGDVEVVEPQPRLTIDPDPERRVRTDEEALIARAYPDVDWKLLKYHGNPLCSARAYGHFQRRDTRRDGPRGTSRGFPLARDGRRSRVCPLATPRDIDAQRKRNTGTAEHRDNPELIPGALPGAASVMCVAMLRTTETGIPMRVRRPRHTDLPEKPRRLSAASRRTEGGICGTLIGLLLLGTVASCSSSDPPDSEPAREAPTSTAPAPGSGSADEEHDGGKGGNEGGEGDGGNGGGELALPEPLVGAWKSNPEDGTANISYRFLEDGRYEYVGLLFYPNAEGDVVEITFVQEGTARVEGNELVLSPTTATRSLKDPSDPAGDYTDQPSDLTPVRHQWEVADDALTLIGEQGEPITFERQSL
ncbi:hypothetical protein AB0I82_13830 [Streptomyces sp. NPDC050315]|uniref:hypothetical protein n=1 Tax=Streptomyces sp. NPDC050315 TaxID=3155039 RepID=UPI0034279E0B